MKHYNFYRITLQMAFLVVLISLAYSCLNSKKETTAPIESATDVNEVTLDDSKDEEDAKFIVKAAEINFEEIKLGQLAQKLGSSSHVRDLGKMMEADHTKSLEEITELAKTKLVNIPTDMSFDAQDAYNKLNAKSSIEFDKAYSEMMVNGHQKAIEIFEKTCNDATDPEVRDWATNMLPALKMHLEHALMCQKECNKKV